MRQIHFFPIKTPNLSCQRSCCLDDSQYVTGLKSTLFLLYMCCATWSLIWALNQPAPPWHQGWAKAWYGGQPLVRQLWYLWWAQLWSSCAGEAGIQWKSTKRIRWKNEDRMNTRTATFGWRTQMWPECQVPEQATESPHCAIMAQSELTHPWQLEETRWVVRSQGLYQWKR